VARAFTAIALVAVPVSLVTGLLLAGRLIPSVGALLNTDYGHALLLKLGLLIAGLLCATATFTLLVLGAGRRRAAVAVIAEAVVLCAVVLTASAVASLPPASAVVWAPDSTSLPTSGVLSQIARDLVVTVDMGPGRPGRNFITVGVLDTRRPAPAPIAAVQVAVGGQGPLTAVRQDPFKWMVVTNVATEGPEQLQVAVRRPGEPTVVVPFVWVAGPPLGTRLGGASLSPVSSVAAAVVGLCALIGLALGLVLRIRRRSGPVREDDVWPGRRQHASKGSGSTSPTVDREPWAAEEARDSPTGV
jgi:copper transport protein